MISQNDPSFICLSVDSVKNRIGLKLFWHPAILIAFWLVDSSYVFAFYTFIYCLKLSKYKFVAHISWFSIFFNVLKQKTITKTHPKIPLKSNKGLKVFTKYVLQSVSLIESEKERKKARYNSSNLKSRPKDHHVNPGDFPRVYGWQNRVFSNQRNRSSTRRILSSLHLSSRTTSIA